MTSMRWFPGIGASLLLAVVLLAGCDASSGELKAAYEQGYEDGMDAAAEAAIPSDGEGEVSPEQCGDCYALGWDEGYQQGYADGAASG